MDLGLPSPSPCQAHTQTHTHTAACCRWQDRRPKNTNACPGDNQHGQGRPIPIQQHPVPEFKFAVMEMEYRSVAV
jgi:hypothetical protein